jgi:hypothetical protein
VNRRPRLALVAPAASPPLAVGAAAGELLALERLQRDPDRRRPGKLVPVAVRRRIDGLGRLLREGEHE